jgi:hypothetical protein
VLQSKTYLTSFETRNTDVGAILGFTIAFKTLIGQTGDSTSKSLTQYIRCSQVAETIHAHLRMLSALVPHLDVLESTQLDRQKMLIAPQMELSIVMAHATLLESSYSKTCLSERRWMLWI